MVDADLARHAARGAMTRFLVTGGGGFVGQWLARLLIERGDDVTLAGFGSLGGRAGDPDRRRSARAVRWVAADVREQAASTRWSTRRVPTSSFTWPAIAFPPRRGPRSGRDVRRQRRWARSACSRALRRAARGRHDRSDDARRGNAASSTACTDAERDAADARSAEQRPLTPYAASKTAQEVAALQAFRASGGPGRLHAQLQSLGRGPAPRNSCFRRSWGARARFSATAGATLSLGNDAVRDYLHVTDVAAAYLALAGARSRRARCTTSAVGRASVCDSWPPMSCFASACPPTFRPHHRSFVRLTFRCWWVRRRS